MQSNTFLTIFQDNFLDADITHKTNNWVFLFYNNIAFAPLSSETPLTLADSSDVLVGSWISNLNWILLSVRYLWIASYVYGFSYIYIYEITQN